MKKSPIQIAGSLITSTGIILAVISCFQLKQANDDYNVSVRVVQTRLAFDKEASIRGASKAMANNPDLEATDVIKMKGQIDSAANDTAQERLANVENDFSTAKILWGSGCGGGVVLAVIGFLVNRRGKSIVESQKKCPFCSETIKREAIKCKFCGADLAAQPASKPTTPPTLPPVTPPKAKAVDPFARPTTPRFLRQENGAIHFECGYCNQHIEIDATGGGAEIKCPECGERQNVPTS